MLKHKSLFSPVMKDESIPDSFFKKYINIHNKHPRSAAAPKELIDEVKTRFYDSHTNNNKTRLDAIWAFASKALSNNEALVKFVLDNGGAESDFFFPWMITVASSPSEALELSYNAGRNIDGDWITKIPEEDNISFFVKNLPTLAYNRERQIRVADLVMTDRDMMAVDETSKVMDLGAGRMAWARHHGFIFNPKIQQFYACDIDTTIQPKDLFPKTKLKDIELVYERKDVMEELKNPSVKDPSLVILQGVASYYPMNVFTETVVKPVYSLLRTGGGFFFDLQLNHISYEWSVKVFGWPEMKLPNKASDAIDMIEAMRKKLWKDGMRFSAEYALDTYNESALSVMVFLTKL